MPRGKKPAEFYESILDSASEATVVFRPASGKLVYANRAFADLTGISHRQLADKTFYFYLGKGAKNRVLEGIEPLTSGAERRVELTFVFEVPLRPPRDILAVFALVGGSSARPLVCASLRDVTEFALGLQAQVDRLNRLDRVIEGSPQAIIVTDMQGRIRRANHGARKLLGYTSREITDKRYIQDRYEGDADSEILDKLRSDQFGEPGTVERYPTIAITRNRHRIPVWVNVHVLKGLADEEIGLAHFLTDVREVIEAEKKLEEVQLQLIHADKMASLGKLAAGVAHEINNPLGGILLFGGLLLEDMDFSDPRREDMTRVVQEARRCKEIVNSLLDFAHQRKRYFEPVDINAAVEQCLSLLGNKAIFHNIEIETCMKESIPLVTGNPSQIKQVFTNLITNAVDAMEGEGRLEITSFTDERAGEVGVIFCDTGPGVPSDVQARIFDPFFTTKEPGKGTGLGLSLSYNIIHMHRGDIRLRNVPGSGAEFTVVLPINEEEEL